MASLSDGLKNVPGELADKVIGWGEAFVLELPNPDFDIHKGASLELRKAG